MKKETKEQQKQLKERQEELSCATYLLMLVFVHKKAQHFHEQLPVGQALNLSKVDFFSLSHQTTRRMDQSVKVDEPMLKEQMKKQKQRLVQQA